MTQSTQYSYLLAAQKEGTYTIPGATAMSGGRQLQSGSVTITVSGKPAAGNNSVDNSGGEVFMRAIADKTSCWMGEAVVVTYKIYTTLNIVNLSLEKSPSFNGFFVREIDLPQTISWQKENYNGKTYNAGVLKQVVLFPQRAGTLTVDALSLDLIVQKKVAQQSQNLFGNFFNDPFFNDPFFSNPFGGGYQNVKQNLKNPSVAINVKSLPAGAPESFSGAVGNFKLKSTCDPLKLKANEPVTLRVQIEGNGNFPLIDSVHVLLPADAETYDVKQNDRSTASASGLSGTKEFEYLFIPRHQGDYLLAPPAFSYFDPASSSYKTIHGEEYKIKVSKGTEESTGNTSGISKEEVKLLNQDIRFIHPFDSEEKSSSPFFGTALFWSLFALPLAGFGGLIVYARRQNLLLADARYMRNKKTSALVRRHLKEARSLLTRKKDAEAYESIYKALWNFAGGKLGIDNAELTHELTEETMRNNSVPENQISSFKTLAHECEMARFAPNAVASPAEMLQQAELVLTELEDSLLQKGGERK